MATLQAAPPRGRGRGRGSLSYLSLQQSLDKMPPLNSSTLPIPEKSESQFEDAPGAYPTRSISPPEKSVSPQVPPPVGPFSAAPPTKTFSTTPTPNPPTPTPPPTYTTPPPPTPPPVTPVVKPPPVAELVKTAANNKFSSDDLLEKLKPYLPEGAEDVARAIHAICIANRDFSKTAALCCQSLTLLDKGGAEFRSFLLRGLQSDFKNRATIFEKSESDFLSCVTLLCEVFAVMRDRSGLPLLPLATPVVEYLSMMLQDFSLTNNASHVLAHNLSLVGPLLREKAPEKEQALIENVRQKILDEKTESLTRCQLLRVFESSLTSWQPLSDPVASFYNARFNNLQ